MFIIYKNVRTCVIDYDETKKQTKVGFCTTCTDIACDLCNVYTAFLYNLQDIQRQQNALKTLFFRK